MQLLSLFMLNTFREANYSHLPSNESTRQVDISGFVRTTCSLNTKKGGIGCEKICFDFTIVREYFPWGPSFTNNRLPEIEGFYTRTKVHPTLIL